MPTVKRCLIVAKQTRNNMKRETPETISDRANCCVSFAKMTRRTNHFNPNQKVWLQMLAGSLAAKVVGRYRGKGRYVSAWVKWDTQTKPMPEWATIEVDKSFAERHSILRQNAEVSHPTKED